MYDPSGAIGRTENLSARCNLVIALSEQASSTNQESVHALLPGPACFTGPTMTAPGPGVCSGANSTQAIGSNAGSVRRRTDPGDGSRDNSSVDSGEKPQGKWNHEQESGQWPHEAGQGQGAGTRGEPSEEVDPTIACIPGARAIRFADSHAG